MFCPPTHGTSLAEPQPDPSSPHVQRACRRHGIQRWPRRQLLKLSRAIDQINQTTTTEPSGSTPKRRSPPEGAPSSQQVEQA